MASSEGPDPDEICYEGCDCRVPSCDDVTSCSCLQKFGRNYVMVTSDGRRARVLKSIERHDRGEIAPPVFECNAMCRCGEGCGNREVQNGVRVPLLVFRSNDARGLGVRTLGRIPRGRFVCEYAGEVLGESEAARRVRAQNGDVMNYVIGVREYAGNSLTATYVDPSKRGNVGRFINHSCEPNLVMVPVRVDSDVIRLALFARRSIEEEEELTFHYGGCHGTSGDEADPKFPAKPCLCGSQSCTGRLPFDATLFPA